MKRDDLLVYYERELRFIRRMAAEFGEKYPEVAARLLIEPTKCEDPHIERLIEAFSMLTARIHLRLDDDFADINDALLDLLYPHYLRPVPSMSIARLEADPAAANVPGGLRVDAHSLLHTQPVRGVRCTFRTAYPVQIFPLEVEGCELISATDLNAPTPENVRSALRIRLATKGGAKISELEIDRLRFFLDAVSGDVHSLYEAFLRRPEALWVRASGDAAPSVLPARSIREVGFERDEGLLDYPAESFVGFRLLQEYFTFPEKFLFVDLCDLQAASAQIDGTGLVLDVLLPDSLAQLDLDVGVDNLKLDCTPVVNLFPHTADPIRVTHASVEYPVVPDARAPTAYEVYAVRAVEGSKPGRAGRRSYRPFYGLRHGAQQDEGDAYWHARRRASLRKGDTGSDVSLSLVDADSRLADPEDEVLHVETICSNRDLPARLPFGLPAGDFQLEGRPGIARITALRKPTGTRPPPVGAASRWRLVSHLALNHLSLTGPVGGSLDASPHEAEEALSTLREVLKLYDFEDSAVTRQRIAGVTALRARGVVRRVAGHGGGGFARGVEVDVEFDPAQYTGSGVFLFASVLERFFALHASVNAFTQMVARVQQQAGELKHWPARAGARALL